MVLMGKRPAGGAFMPNKFVFPGGAVDTGDADIMPVANLNEICCKRLAEQNDTLLANALAIAAIRELYEETGLILGASAPWPDAPPQWSAFAQKGFRPAVQHLYYFYRAITPLGQSRRFDARFFVADACHIRGDLDYFAHEGQELSQLQWIGVKEAETLDLALITRFILRQVQQIQRIAPPPEIIWPKL